MPLTHLRRVKRHPLLIVPLIGYAFFLTMCLTISHDLMWTITNEPLVLTKIRSAWMQTTKRAMIYEQDAMASVNCSESVENEQPLQSHLYRSDGLLTVNPRGPHPIFELIERAEADWRIKLGRASRTLQQAVTEYHRRYHRPPPLGFDKWWSYVEANKVQLPDEYDQIYNDLEPFWGMNPSDLQALQRAHEADEDSYTIGKDAGGLISIVNYALRGDEETRTRLTRGAFHVMEMLEEVEEFIPPFRAVFSPHDNPELVTNWELKQSALEAAATRNYIDVNNPPKTKARGWISACDPKSSAWRYPIDWNSPPPVQQKKTFIYHHRKAMNPCDHPSLFLLQGQYLSHHSGPTGGSTMVPQFSHSPTPLHHDITIAMPNNWVEDISRSDDPEWNEKIDDRLQWRGSNTGITHKKGTKWRSAQRARLVAWANAGFGENITVLAAPRDVNQTVGSGMEVKKGRYSPAMLDVSFAGKPLFCDPETCALLMSMFEFRQPQDTKAAGNYKYILDVDGHGWSSRFKRLMTSKALIFKSTVFPEWFTDRIAPWVHYVPVQADFSDLYDSLIFFRGDLDGSNAHEDLARKIAMSGRGWSKRFWRKQDLTAYMFRLFLEYARVMSPDRNAMSFHYS